VYLETMAKAPVVVERQSKRIVTSETKESGSEHDQMDPETQKDVEHLLDDQMANIRRTYEQLKVGEKPEAIRSCLLPTERQDAIECLEARLPSTGMARTVAQPQQPETIRVLVFYGGDVSVFDLPQIGEG
jgi:hypothetical protein